MSTQRKLRRGISNVAVGAVLAVVTAGVLAVIVQWARTQVAGIPSRVAEGVTVVPHRVGSDLIIVNYGSKGYTSRLVNEDGEICSDLSTVQLPPRNTVVVTTSCSVRWVEVNGNLLRVMKVASR